jgi:ABC-type multidrug transport system permease subunit
MTAMRRFSISSVAAQGITSIIMQGKSRMRRGRKLLRYFMEIMRMVYLKGSSICDIGFQLSVLSSFALLLYAWAIRSYRKQQ